MSIRRDNENAVSQQGHYAGAATRLVAYVVDAITVTALYTAGVATAQYSFNLVTDSSVSFSSHPGVMGAGYLLWWVLYFTYPMAMSGKTLGMAIFGIRVVRRDGSVLNARRALLRVVTFPLGFLTLGIGFLGIVFGREHRAIYDRIADTAVVYAWDARAAQLRFLARTRVEVEVEKSQSVPVVGR